MSVGIGLIEIVVLLGACAAVIAILRNPKWLKWFAIPVGMLALLGAISIVISLGAPSYRTVVPAEEESADDPVYETFNANTFPVVFERPAPVHNITWSRLAMLTAIVLIPMVGGAAVFGSRKWIARNASVLIPLSVVGFAGVLVFGVVALYLVQDTREGARRVEAAQRLRAMGVAVHHGSSHTEGARSSSSGPDSLDLQNGDVIATEKLIAASEETVTEAATETTAAVSELPDWARGETVDWRKLREGVHQNPVVLKSDDWSSVPEAEVQLEAMAAQALQQQLRMQHGSSFGWQPSKDFVHQSGAIQQRFVEQTVLNLESGPMPMVRSYWQVSATPHVSELAKQEWKAAAVEERLTLLGAGAAILTLLFAGGAAGLRFDSATSGRYRRRMAAAVAIVGSLAATTALFVA